MYYIDPEIYTTILLAGAVVLLVSFLYSLFRVEGLVGRLFLASLLTVFFWITFYSLELASPGVESKRLFHGLLYIPVCILPVLWYLMVLGIAGKGELITVPRVAGLLVIPAVVLVLVWTNEYHHLFWSVSELAPARTSDGRSVPYLYLKNGPVYWFGIGFLWLLNVVTTVRLVINCRRNRPLFLKQFWLLAFCAILITGTNAVWALEAPFFRFLDPTPMAFVMALTLCTLVFIPTKAFRVIPVARGVLIETMEDGIMVIDNRERIVDANPAMQALTGIKRINLLGKVLGEVFEGCTALLASFRYESDGIPVRCHGRLYEVRRNPMKTGRTEGILLVIRDVTEQVAALSLIEDQSRIISLFQGTTPPVKNPAGDKDPRLDNLSERQREVLDLVARGYTYRDIGEKLFLSERTIKYHMGEIFNRINVENRTEAVILARQNGLGVARTS